MRETKNVPIGDMASVFDVPTRNLVLYRVRVYLPYLFKRHILRKDVAIVPLEESRYKFAPIALDGAEMSLDHRS